MIWCWHNWTKWFDTEVVWSEEPKPGGGTLRTPFIPKQQRRCVKCNLAVTRWT